MRSRRGAAPSLTTQSKRAARLFFSRAAQRAAEHDAVEEDADARSEEHRAAGVAAAVRDPLETPTLFRF